jgi:hypothetical protein
VKVVRLIKMRLDESYYKVLTGNYLSLELHIKNDVRKEYFITDTFEYCFRYAIRNVQAIKEGLELNETQCILLETCR